MVELEDIRMGNYFAHRQRVIAITEEHYGQLSALSAELEPLHLIPRKLFSLGFGTIRAQDFNGFTKTCNNVEVCLKAGPKQQWMVYVGGVMKTRSVGYVHELQNLWYWLFAEPLKRVNE